MNDLPFTNEDVVRTNTGIPPTPSRREQIKHAQALLLSTYNDTRYLTEGNYTFAVRLPQKRADGGKNTLYKVATAVRHPNDQHNKYLGRLYALHNLKCGHYIEVKAASIRALLRELKMLGEGFTEISTKTKELDYEPC